MRKQFWLHNFSFAGILVFAINLYLDVLFVEYLFLAIAIVGELAGTTFIKYSEGFTKPLPSIICAVAYIASFYCFSKALLNINLSIAYATWCGVGIVVTSVISVLIFRQAITGWGVLGIALILAGTVLVNLCGTPAANI